MLVQVYRPRRFNEVFGQPVAVEVLRSIVQDPSKAPRALIFHGERGCGKTSCARILVKALNCKDPGVGGEACGRCPACKSTLLHSPTFQEYDASDVGKKETVQAIKDDILYFSAPPGTWRVVVIDEAHAASREAQVTLHKILEEMPKDLFFVFCTTEPDRLLDTIRSRCIEVAFPKVPSEAVEESLRRIVSMEKLDIPPLVLERIVSYSRGHVRDAVMRLNLYMLIGDAKVFLDNLRSVELELINLLILAKAADRDNYQKMVYSILECPLSVVNREIFEVIERAIRLFVMEELKTPYLEPYQALVSLYGKELFTVLKVFSMPWVVQALSRDTSLQAFLWSFFYQVGGESRGSAKASTLMSRARKRSVQETSSE